MTKKLSYALVGVVVIILVALPLIYQNQKGAVVDLSSTIKISQLGSNAFGELTGGTDQAMPDSEAVLGRGASDMVNEAKLSVGAGGGGMPLPESAVQTVGSFAPDRKVISYTYTYVGEEFTQEEAQLAVLKRVKGDQAAKQLGKILSQTNFDLVDLKAFSDLKVNSLNLYEDKDYGYSLYLSPQEGNISINKHWSKWPQPESRCLGGEPNQRCFEQNRLTEADLPADDEAIAVANDFLKQRNINTSVYGQPKVNNTWRIFYARAENKANYYFPETVSIVYPLVINDLTVYGEAKNEYGMMVSVDARTMKVSDVYGLNTQIYEGSLYDAETNVEEIIKFAQDGGKQSYSPYGEVSKTINLELNTPALVYLRTWNYKTNGQQPDELLVPALIFPIVELPTEGDFYQENIIVPLVKDFWANNWGGGPIQILEMPAVDSVTIEAPVEIGVDLDDE